MSDHQCPTCHRSFDTPRGRSVHHSAVHDERLPNRTCAQCDDRFYSSYEKKYCSEDCLEAAQPYAGENNPNYQDKDVETECDLCGTAFTYYPSNKVGRFCAECVETRSWRTPPTLAGMDLEGEDHPRWNGGKTAIDCAVCGETVERYPSGIEGEVTLCSDECQYEWVSETFEGSGHPNWAGGGSLAYGKGWNRVRSAALERDGYACQVCGKSKAAIGRNPDVHHIVSVRWFIETDGVDRGDAHTLDNVVSLCVACHRRADHGRIPDAVLYSVAGVEVGGEGVGVGRGGGGWLDGEGEVGVGDG